MQNDKNTELRSAFDQRYNAMLDARSSFLPFWQAIADLINPRSVLINNVVNAGRGDRINQKIIDPTATLAIRTLKSGMMAGLTSPSRPWFSLSPSDDGLAKRAAVKEWLYLVQKTMFSVFAKSNLYMVLPMIYGDLGGSGTAAMSVEEHDTHVIRCFPYQIGTYMIAVDDEMRVDTMYREIPMTVQQLVQKFGRENCTQSVQSNWDSNQTQTIVPVRHVLEPNDDRDPQMMDAKNKPIRSVYYETGGSAEQFLRQSGYDEFPIMAPRWDIFNSSDPYGYSPAMDAYGQVKGLQFEHKKKYQAIDKYVDPHLLADSSLRNQITHAIPGGVTFIEGLASGSKAGMRRLEQDLPDLSHIKEDIQEIRQIINKCFYVDLMQALIQSDGPEKTAREIEEIHSEKVYVLGPLMERLNDELFDPLIERTFNIMLRKGMIPKPPEELQGQTLKVVYTSILAQAMKMMGVTNDDKLLQGVGSAAQLDNKALDKFDADEWIDGYADKLGVNPRIIRSADQVKELRDQRQKAQQAAQMAQMAQPMEHAAKAGKALGETDPDNVKKIVGMMTGQA